MQFTDEQLANDAAIELKLNDKSKLEYAKVLSNDKVVYEKKTFN